MTSKTYVQHRINIQLKTLHVLTQLKIKNHFSSVKNNVV